VVMLQISSHCSSDSAASPSRCIWTNRKRYVRGFGRALSSVPNQHLHLQQYAYGIVRSRSGTYLS
jgi:hypothetical protein